MTELMDSILELNGIDRAIVRGKLRLQELSRDIQDQEKRVEQAREAARGIENAIKDTAFSTDRLNMEIRAAEAEVGDQERKLKTIKNQKEFRIVTDRIRDLKIQVDEGESSVIAGMEELDKLREKMTAAHDRIGEEDLKLTSVRQAAQAEAAELKARHQELVARRSQAVAKVESLDAPALQAYDLALKRTKGDPVAVMSADGICQSCFRRQNSNVANIVHIGSDVKNCRCQGCGRIIYMKPGQDGDAADDDASAPDAAGAGR